jgi:hypothetical protein
MRGEQRDNPELPRKPVSGQQPSQVSITLCHQSLRRAPTGSRVERFELATVGIPTPAYGLRFCVRWRSLPEIFRAAAPQRAGLRSSAKCHRRFVLRRRPHAHHLGRNHGNPGTEELALQLHGRRCERLRRRLRSGGEHHRSNVTPGYRATEAASEAAYSINARLISAL